MLWFGLGLVVLDASRKAYGSPDVYEPRFRPAGPLLAEIRRLALSREADAPPALAAHAEAEELRARLGALNVELAAARTRERELDAQLRAAAEREQLLHDRIARADRTIGDITGSPSWRLTEPLRAAKRIVARH